MLRRAAGRLHRLRDELATLVENLNNQLSQKHKCFIISGNWAVDSLLLWINTIKGCWNKFFNLIKIIDNSEENQLVLYKEIDVYIMNLSRKIEKNEKRIISKEEAVSIDIQLSSCTIAAYASMENKSLLKEASAISTNIEKFAEIGIVNEKLGRLARLFVITCLKLINEKIPSLTDSMPNNPSKQRGKKSKARKNAGDNLVKLSHLKEIKKEFISINELSKHPTISFILKEIDNSIIKQINETSDNLQKTESELKRKIKENSQLKIKKEETA